jgi:protein TonB
MPRTLFDQVLVSTPPRRSSRWIRAVSLVLHLAAGILLLVLPLTAAMDLPGIYTKLPPVMLASVPELPPTPPPPAAVAPVATSAPSVPLEAPDGVQEEIERPPVTSSVAVPGGLPVAGSGSPFVGVLRGSTITVAPPPEQQPQLPRRVGGDIKPPERTVYKAPVYPQMAQAARVEGIVILEATIDAQGVVQNVSVLRSVPLLDRAAIEAVQQWRYSPTRLNGVAIPIVMTVTVTFSMR